MDRRKIVILLFLCYALLSIFRLIAPSDIDNRDQAKQGLYVLDLLQKGSFFLPNDLGRPTTKPPLYTWVAAGISLVWGEVTDITIKLPAIFSGLGVLFVTFLIGELLFSKEIGLLAGLILILSYHFADLITLARTDMMHCFFVSLSLYLFLLAYRERGEPSRYSLLMFVAMGLGSLTKSPVAFLLPSLIILIFLFFRGDLKWLKSMRTGLGFTIWALIMLGWFIPALIMGGRGYFHIVFLDEMVNRFLGIGTRAEKAQPFYFLIGHFFGKFLPWSLFVPSALVRYWKSRNETGKYGLLFLISWFLTVLIFFSVSKGKRADYILPLYPAASVMVGQFWFSLMKRGEANHWKGHLRGFSLGYFILNFCLSTSLIILLAQANLLQSIDWIPSKGLETIRLLPHSIRTQINLFFSFALPLAGASILGGILVFRGRVKHLFILLLVVTAINLSFYFEILSPEAIRGSGKQKKAFCSRAADKIKSVDHLKFHDVESSIFFYMGKNIPPMKDYEVLEFFRTTEDPYLITTEPNYLALGKRADFEFVVLEKSEYLFREKTTYVLLGKKRPYL